MKKYVLAVLFLIPCVSIAAPSVRVLGNQNAAVKVAPVKTPTLNKSTQNVPTRSGTLRNKNVGITGAITGAGTRFPVITNAKMYNNATQPSGGTGISSGSGGTVISDSVIRDIKNDVADTVLTTVQNNYYNKTEVYNTGEVYNKDEVYNNNQFVESVKDVDDPRIDAIRIQNPTYLHPGVQLPDDYIYIWIEQ